MLEDLGKGFGNRNPLSPQRSKGVPDVEVADVDVRVRDEAFEHAAYNGTPVPLMSVRGRIGSFVGGLVP